MFCVIHGIAVINSLAPVGFGCNSKKSIFKLNLLIGTFQASFDKVPRWMIPDLTDKSTLGQVMAWCHQATSHYLSQCWPRSMSPYGVIRPQWVNILLSWTMLQWHSIVIRKEVQCSAVITWVFSKFSRKTPYSSHVRARYGISFVDSNCALPQSLQWCRQYNAILYRIITALNCTVHIEAWAKWLPFHRKHFKSNIMRENFIFILIWINFVHKGPINSK